MGKYASIKQLVIDEAISNGELPSLEQLTLLVKEHFPDSRWQKSHYDYYKSLIKTGKINIGKELVVDPFADGEDRDEERILEFGLSLERDLQAYLSARLGEVEEGLTLVGTQYNTSAGLVDILAKDVAGNHVVIELKAGRAKDAALGQLLGYMGALMEDGVLGSLRGVLIASDFDTRVVYASRALPGITLFRYSLSFRFEAINKKTNKTHDEP